MPINRSWRTTDHPVCYLPFTRCSLQTTSPRNLIITNQSNRPDLEKPHYRPYPDNTHFDGEIDKCMKYNVPLHMTFVDYRKAFDSIAAWAVMSALNGARVDYKYANLLKHIYEN